MSRKTYLYTYSGVLFDGKFWIRVGLTKVHRGYDDTWKSYLGSCTSVETVYGLYEFHEGDLDFIYFNVFLINFHVNYYKDPLFTWFTYTDENIDFLTTLIE